ncbi:hypothetical protein SAMN02745725_02895 [Pseudobutyrivibrio xylanivorans DSM 14809]|uniref:GtrA-like protein n=1 Tax=Pseudobutyrivibrio xylanivorans DSM 14809 TaxID=1123012 RepID=A0A1M6KMF1_PSEXY|nr:hypothetical protein SAMN02745725_02895 [Pseudobutyrivibrio xylanivorans DSM 14809]
MKTYILYAFTGLIVNNVLSTFWIYVLGISKYITPLLNVPITMPINFVIQKMGVQKIIRKHDTL